MLDVPRLAMRSLLLALVVTAAGCTSEPTPPPVAQAPAPAPAPMAQDPVALAAQITQAEQTIRSDAGPDALAQAGQVQQAAYRHLAARGELRPAVLVAVPDDLDPVVVAHTDAQDAIRAAARYLKSSGAPQRMERALFAYNRSDAYVAGVEMHASQMRTDPRTYRGYYHWQVYYRTTDGDRVLPVGYDGRVSSR